MRVLPFALVLLLTGCAPAVAAEPVPEVRTVSAPAQHALSFAAVGDSISAWVNPYNTDPGQSWVNTAAVTMPLVGGWARTRATLAIMSAEVTAAPTAYYLVVMGGTNDMFEQTPISERLLAIDLIAATVNARNVILSAVAPYNPDPAAATQWNSSLAAYADLRGWGFIDPWQEVRTAEGTWVVGADFGDGVHPNPTTAAQVGTLIAAELTARHNDEKPAPPVRVGRA